MTGRRPPRALRLLTVTTRVRSLGSLVVLALLAAGPASPAPTESTDGRAPRMQFRGRTYRVAWPDGDARGVLIFMHGLSRQPFVEEGEGMAAIARIANARGMVAVFPRARRLCGAGKRCWSTADPDGELGYVDALVDHLERQSGARFDERQIVGFSNGGFLVGAGVEQGLLDDYGRVGIIAAGPVGHARHRSLSAAPPIFIEVGTEDRYQRGSTERLYRRFDAMTPKQLLFREVPGRHVINAARAESFLAWFWKDDTSSHRALTER